MLPDYVLLHAIKFGLSRNFDRAILLGADIDARDIDGRTAIEIAGEYGRLGFIRKLASQGADVNQSIGMRGEKLLHRAARTGNLGFASELLQLGANPSPTNNAGRTPLHLAAISGHQYLADELIAQGASIEESTPQGDRPLHIAARQGDLAMIKALLRAGASISATSNTGYTPLHEAAAAGHTQAAQLMIDSDRFGYHERSVLLPRVRRAAELHGHAATADAILAAEGRRERAEQPREMA